MNSATETVVLVPDNWDDWFEFETTFHVFFFDLQGGRHDLGLVKVGEFGLLGSSRTATQIAGSRRPSVPAEAEVLPESLFSLGQDVSYYLAVQELGPQTSVGVHLALRDMAYDEDIWTAARDEVVTIRSLARSISEREITVQFRRIARGGDGTVRFEIGYQFPRDDCTLDFLVDPSSSPPSNVHVIVGRNGVGKSTLLASLATTIVGLPGPSDLAGAEVTGIRQVSSVVSVAFSAFDIFPDELSRDHLDSDPTHRYIGLRNWVGARERIVPFKNLADLLDELKDAAENCGIGAKKDRLDRALGILEADPIFSRLGLRNALYPADDERGLVDVLSEVFDNLSSGHKIVLLSVIKLVAFAEEQCLVLIDEPEAHLHPPLLSAFVRFLSDLMTSTNGVAIVATHSPVVLQEVPRGCVWMLSRAAGFSKAERPARETFGENTGRLTEDVFGLEVLATGFHNYLTQLHAEHQSYDEALGAIGGRLGSEGRLILRSLYVVGELNDVDR